MPRILPDHNGGVSENTFYHHDRIIESINSQMASLRSKLGTAKKAMSDDGLDWDDYKYAKKQRARTLADQIASHNRRLSYMKFLKMPIADKLPNVDAFSDETDLTDEQRQEKWENEGYVAAREGKGMDSNPHDPNSISGRFYNEGWRRGQEENAKGIKAGPKPETAPAPTGAKKRGRPSKADKEAAEAAAKAAAAPAAPPANDAGEPAKAADEGAPAGGAGEQTAENGSQAAPAAGEEDRKPLTDEEWAAAAPKKAASDTPFGEPAAPPGTKLN